MNLLPGALELLTSHGLTLTSEWNKVEGHDLHLATAKYGNNRPCLVVFNSATPLALSFIVYTRKEILNLNTKPLDSSHAST